MFSGMNRWRRDSQADSMVRVEEEKHVTWDTEEKGLFFEGDGFLIVVLKKIESTSKLVGRDDWYEHKY